MVAYDEEAYATFLLELTELAHSLPKSCVSRPIYQKIEVPADASEYKTAEHYVTTGKVPHLELVKVYKIKAPHLEAKFNCHRSLLMNQYYDHQSILEALERDVFHGTQEDITTKILARGFDPKFGSLDPKRAKFGQGCYFARDIHIRQMIGSPFQELPMVSSSCSSCAFSSGPFFR